MTANQYLIMAIGLFFVITAALYLRQIKMKEEGGRRERTVSVILLLVGLVITAIPITSVLRPEEEDGQDFERKGSLMGSDVYNNALPSNTQDHDKATALYVKAVGYWNEALSGFDSSEVALDLLNRSIQNYETAEALTARGQLKVQLGKFKSGLEDYFRAVELDPDFGNAYYNRAAVYYVMGQLNYACSDWQTAHDLGVPNTEEVLKMYCK